jgi:membrane fusion protein, multidrug efflux system
MKTKTLLLSIGVTLVLFVACSKDIKQAAATQQKVCVKAETLEESSASVPVQSSGILSSRRMIKLSFKTGGIIAGIYVNEGSQVHKGQVIAELDMTEISAQVEQARLAFEKAERTLNRINNLYRDTVATLEQLQDATSAFKAALEDKNVAEFNLKHSRIIAPANGKIIAKLSEEHELVGPGNPVLILSEQGRDEWIIKAGVSDRDIININRGDSAWVSLDAFPGVTLPAFVSQISEAADPLSGTFQIEVSLLPGNRRLINGLVAKVIVEPASNQTVTLVPPDALTEANGNKGYVYVVETTDTTARKVPVTIAYMENNSIAVLEKLNDYGLIVTEGAAYLENGSKLNVSR